MDALLLSRIQFFWVVAFHILLPAFTVGLACYVATLEFLWWRTGSERWRRISAFWTRIFAVSFGMGVVSGIVMPFQFGTNWSRYVDTALQVVGGLMAYEVVTAFFLEAAFLGVLLFGRDRVPPWAHFMSAVMVALGTLMSSFWILSVNSWMHTPAGFEIVDGRWIPTDMMQVVFNPSFPFRLAHTVSAFLVTTGFVVLAVSARFLLQRRFEADASTMLRMALAFLGVMVPTQILLGDLHGLNTLEHQPAKVAAMEGLWETGRGVSASLFAIPDPANERNRFEIAIPKLGSLYLTHDWNGEVKGLKEWAPEDRPPVAIVYASFRVMVGIGLAMLAVVASGLWLWWRRRLLATRAWLRVASWTLPLGFVAVIAGWITTEVGRQPWVVYGHLRTADAVTPSLATADVALSLAAYVTAYLVIFGGGLVLLRRMVRAGPVPPKQAMPVHGHVKGDAGTLDERPKRPLSAAVDPPPDDGAAAPR
ncbi:MAG TPA: cytochrome ubiquinol oxidase subunit I [Burkholderiaceae bacterium]|nr:cytochrome ubiquinol oxidase subunit I [Burkholderiaceae bacterium]